jgi:multidrug resistance efflux pump
LRKALMIGVALLIAVLAFILRVTGGRYLSTDDACIRARKLMVSSQGDVLFRIDPKQFQIAVEDAKAQLAQAAPSLLIDEAGLPAHAQRRGFPGCAKPAEPGVVDEVS